jgi:hypothetical protein
MARDRPQVREGRRLPRAAFLLLAILSSSCSFVIVRPAPPREDWPEPVRPDSSEDKCTDSIAPPVADLVFSSILGSLTYIERNSGSPALTIGIGIAAVPPLVSSIWGFAKTAQCRRYKARFR